MIELLDVQPIEDTTTVLVQKLVEDARPPERKSDNAAGLDLYAHIINRGGVMPGVTYIRSHETMVIRTGIAVEIPEGFFGGIYARSGLATKRGLRPSNCVGVIDSDYRGEVMVALYNDSDTTQAVYDGDRIAQLIIQPYECVNVKVVDELTETERGAGGFGSTGR